MSTVRPRPTLWVGPIAFAGVMVTMAGLFNAVTGLVAIFSDEVYVTSSVGVVVLDVTGWGWVHLLLGLSLLVTGVALLLGVQWARWATVGLLALNMLTQLLLLPAYPFWSLLIIAVDVLVLWALVAHGDEVPGSAPR